MRAFTRGLKWMIGIWDSKLNVQIPELSKQKHCMNKNLTLNNFLGSADNDDNDKHTLHQTNQPCNINGNLKFHLHLLAPPACLSLNSHWYNNTNNNNTLTLYCEILWALACDYVCSIWHEKSAFPPSSRKRKKFRVCVWMRVAV